MSEKPQVYLVVADKSSEQKDIGWKVFKTPELAQQWHDANEGVGIKTTIVKTSLLG